MQLVIGGAFQGKLDYILKETGFSPNTVADMEAEDEERLADPSFWADKKIGNHVHSLIRRWLERGENPEKKMEQLYDACPDMIWIMDEIGCGIVPMEAFERNYREEAGRIGCFLARRAGKVTRVICGIGAVIKKQNGRME